MQKRSQKTQEKILSTSYNLFMLQGYDQTGVAQICATAEISKGAFYHHFPSKHEVLMNLIGNWLQGIDLRFEIIQNEALSTPQKMNLMAAELNEIFVRADQLPMFLEIWIQSIRDPSVSKKVISPYYKYISFFEEIFNQGILEGSFSTEINTHYSSKLIMAFAMGLILQCLIEPHGEDWQNISNFGLEKILLAL